MTPRLLLNENFPEPASSVLRQMGWDAVSVTERMPGTNDPNVLAWARRESRWLVTFDMDYGDLIFRNRLPPPPVVLMLRVPSYRPAEPAIWIQRLVENEQLTVGYFHVFDGNAVRRRSFLAAVETGNG